MMREYQVRFCEGLGVKLPGSTRQSETPNHVRDDGSFPPKRSPGAGGGCTASHSQPRLQLMAELALIADAEAGDPGICNGPKIGIGGSLAAPPLPHHRTYGSVYGGSRKLR